MPLPHGPWLSQLQHLALAVAAMSASLPDLAAGTSSLQKLGVYCGAGREADLVAAPPARAARAAGASPCQAFPSHARRGN